MKLFQLRKFNSYPLDDYHCIELGIFFQNYASLSYLTQNEEYNIKLFENDSLFDDLKPVIPLIKSNNMQKINSFIFVEQDGHWYNVLAQKRNGRYIMEKLNIKYVNENTLFFIINFLV